MAGIVTKGFSRTNTKVRHVDIYQMWIRREVQQGRIAIKWVPTDSMPANRLTNVLHWQKFEDFVR